MVVAPSFPVLQDCDVFAIPGAWSAMTQTLLTMRRPGIGDAARPAIDCALWVLKARILDVALVTLLDRKHAALPTYGSDGLTSYPRDPRVDARRHWARRVLPVLKMKRGRVPEPDVARMAAVRDAIGLATALFVDADGAYGRKPVPDGVMAFVKPRRSGPEEPVSSEDLAGLRLVSDRAPPGPDVRAGEYAYDLFAARRLTGPMPRNVLQADVTRGDDVSGFLRRDALCQAHCVPFSSHTPPAIHWPICVAGPRIRHGQYFPDSTLIESVIFDQSLPPDADLLVSDLLRSGPGWEVKETREPMSFPDHLPETTRVHRPRLSAET
ncbi:enolase C-terminal domain-like protein [Acidiferrobacter sp.]|uniref:enolase C-terminal domain-like protein n=1 Tax=Acidiferrobacter sp. TaxID=1872107 RepID=UPI002630CD3C|nr:enolase C-terminal domain-like protein [Acidiferrobacter sp.]